MSRVGLVKIDIKMANITGSEKDMYLTAYIWDNRDRLFGAWDNGNLRGQISHGESDDFLNYMDINLR